MASNPNLATSHRCIKCGNRADWWWKGFAHCDPCLDKMPHRIAPNGLDDPERPF